MNRTCKTHNNTHSSFLATADSLSDRAARAMCPNGLKDGLAKLHDSNVITLHNDFYRHQQVLPSQRNGRGVDMRYPTSGKQDGKGARDDN